MHKKAICKVHAEHTQAYRLPHIGFSPHLYLFGVFLQLLTFSFYNSIQTEHADDIVNCVKVAFILHVESMLLPTDVFELKPN